MTTAAIWFLLVLIVLLTWLTWIWRHQKLPARAAGIAPVQRLLKPHTPDDCPTCRLAPAALVHPRPLHSSVTPWREVKSRRGAPKPMDPTGFACPKPTCTYYRITDAQIHALVGDGAEGKAEPIQTFRCQACR